MRGAVDERPEVAVDQANAQAGGLARAVRLIDRLRFHALTERNLLMQGLLAPNARINPKYLYDAAGCALYERICTLVEYYPPRCEREIFSTHRDAIARELPRSPQWIDLGCGDGGKSSQWIEVLGARRYVGVDIAREALEATVQRVSAAWAGIEAIGVACDFTHRLDLHEVIAEHRHQASVFFYPGSSIGNFEANQVLAFLRAMRDHLDERGRILVGIDLVKEPVVLQAAYADCDGVTAQFNLNVLRAVNRIIGSDFDPKMWDHQATFDAVASRIEMRLLARKPQSVQIGSVGRRFECGESILTEYSHKYTVPGFAETLAQAGFTRVRAWTDARKWYAVFVAGA